MKTKTNRPIKKFFLLERVSDLDYDQFREIMVRATSEKSARKAAVLLTEEPEIWNNSKHSSCTVVPINGKTEVVCYSYRHG